MPLPKDPEKLAEYKEKMRNIALARGYGKWMLGKTASEESKKKNSKSQKALCTEEECAKRSTRAKELGYGKWMEGRPAHPNVVAAARERKGKTYAEIYGDRADLECAKRKESNTGKKHTYLSDETHQKLRTSLTRKGKKYSDIYGDQATVECAKRSSAHLKKWEGKDRTGCRDKKNGDVLYRKWRQAVFERDSYTCVRCGSENVFLHAHYIQAWATHPHLRYCVDNGQSLCIICHADQHPENAPLQNAKQKEIRMRQNIVKDPVLYEVR